MHTPLVTDWASCPAISLKRRAMLVLYELMLVAALYILFIVLLEVLLLIIRIRLPSIIRSLIPVIAIGYYFVYFWTREGQTLAMKAWRVRIINLAGQLPNRNDAIKRYLLAWGAVIPAWFYLQWVPTSLEHSATLYTFNILCWVASAAFDIDRRLFHERYSATRLIDVAEQAPQRPSHLVEPN